MNIKGCTDVELLQRMFCVLDHSSDNDEAWQEFVARFNPFLYRSIRKAFRSFNPQYLPDHEDLLDLTQQIYAKLSHNNFYTLRDLKDRSQGSIKQYLHAIAVNMVRDFVRDSLAKSRFHYSQSLSDIVNREIDNNPSYSEALYAREADPEALCLSNEMLAEALAVVDEESTDETRERNRKIFLLAYIFGFTRQEIAEQNDINLKRSGVNSFFNTLLPLIKKRLQKNPKTKIIVSLLITCYLCFNLLSKI